MTDVETHAGLITQQQQLLVAVSTAENILLFTVIRLSEEQFAHNNRLS